MPRKARDLTGLRFGRLVVERRNGTAHRQPLWRCACDCGETVDILGGNLRRGTSRSCGCLKRELQTRHGRYGTPEYHVWDAMLRRCTNPAHPGYVDYGGRGITVCERWRSFENFYADMGPRPSSKHSLDRVNNDAGYEKSNCRWATASQQGFNKRTAARVRSDRASFNRLLAGRQHVSKEESTS
jgi:hypothetical protein